MDKLINNVKNYVPINNVKNYVPINPFPFEWVLRALIDFTLSNARRFYSSMGNLLDRKGLISSSFYNNSWKVSMFKLLWM